MSGLKLYAKSKLAEVKSTNDFLNKRLNKRPGKPLLDYACSPETPPELRPTMISTLLELKANPNQIFLAESPWHRILNRVCHVLFGFYRNTDPESLEDRESTRRSLKEEWIPCLTIFLKHGADVAIPTPQDVTHSLRKKAEKHSYAVDWIAECLPDSAEVAEFREQVRRSKKSQMGLKVLPANARVKFLGRAREIS